jgi:hypothetical protein
LWFSPSLFRSEIAMLVVFDFIFLLLTASPNQVLTRTSWRGCFARGLWLEQLTANMVAWLSQLMIMF